MMGNEGKVAALPRGSVLLHIGPPKTGTSALQGACHANREALFRAGVRYVGSGIQPSTAAFAVTEREHPSTGRAPSMRHWRSLVREVRSAQRETLLISSEFFAGASASQIQTIVSDLDPNRLYVAITLRPLVKILASRWQQNVQEGAKVEYHEWLRAVLTAPDSGHARKFWSRQRHDELVDRWTRVVGVERMRVIVVNDRDHESVLRSFEALLAIPSQTLKPHKDSPNRSLTLEEVAIVRSYNEQFSDEGLSPSLRHKLMARGAATHLKRRTPSSGEAKIPTPTWAVEASQRIAREMVAAIRNLGVQVDGDLDQLVVSEGTVQNAEGVQSERETMVRPEIAARLAMGVLFASGATHGYEAASRAPAWGEPYDLQRLSSRQLLVVLAQRLIARALRTLHARRR
jgi:IS5 family transposase